MGKKKSVIHAGIIPIPCIIRELPTPPILIGVKCGLEALLRGVRITLCCTVSIVSPIRGEGGSTHNKLFKPIAWRRGPSGGSIPSWRQPSELFDEHAALPAASRRPRFWAVSPRERFRARRSRACHGLGRPELWTRGSLVGWWIKFDRERNLSRGGGLTCADPHENRRNSILSSSSSVREKLAATEPTESRPNDSGNVADM